MTSDLVWSVLDDPEVESVITSVAARVAFDYDYDADDLIQEARILVANPMIGYVALAETGDYGVIDFRLERDLIDTVRTEVRRRGLSDSYDQHLEDGELDVKITADLDIAGDYPGEFIEILLPAVWDDSFCYGMKAGDAPDPDMPRGSTNKARSNTHWAHIADIRSAWKHADLSVNERKALLMHFGLGFTQQDIGDHEGVNKSTINRRLKSGLCSLGVYLNGPVTNG
jgi:predicted DNA-binding protein (UPF0251 family)